MTEIKTHITRQQAAVYLDDLEEYLSTLPYEGETVLKKADKRKEMIGNLNTKHTHKHYHAIAVRESSQAKIDLRHAELAVSIEDVERQVAIYKQTKTPKEAYFNILNERALRKMTPYVKYAGTYVYEVIKSIHDDENFSSISVHSSNDASNTLPCVVLTFNAQYDWKVDDELNDYSGNPWYLTAGATHHLMLSTLRKSPQSVRDFERVQESVEEGKKYLVDTETKKVKYKRRFFFLPHIKRRIDANVTQLTDHAKKNLMLDYNKLNNAYSRMDSLLPEEEGQEYDLVLEELFRMIDLLNDKLGLNIQTDMQS